MRVRPARQADLPAVVAIEQASFGDPWPPESFASLLERDSAWFAVAEVPEGVVGYAVVFLVADEAEIANIAVHESVRRRGVGAALLDASLAAARAHGAGNVYLEVRPSNVAARALYESRGFVQIGVRRRYYRRPVEDAIVLQCALDATEASNVSADASRRGGSLERRA